MDGSWVGCFPRRHGRFRLERRCVGNLISAGLFVAAAAGFHSRTGALSVHRRWRPDGTSDDARPPRGFEFRRSG